MKALRRLFYRLAAVVTGRRGEGRLREEIEQHIALQTEDNLRAGLAPAEARRLALIKFGGIEAVKEEYRDRRGLPIAENLLRDTRFAFRQLGKSAGFTFTAVLVLALGICASVAIFAFVDGALLQPLPYPDPHRLVGVYEKIPLCPRCNLSYPDYLDWKQRNTVFRSLDAYQGGGVTLSAAGGVEQAAGARVTAGFFRTLGVAPMLGRDFQPGEDQPQAPHTVILSYDAWQKRYGGSRGVLGRGVTLNGEATVIVGVLPRDFHFVPVGAAEFWTALHPSGGCYLRRGCHSLYGVARLRDGVSTGNALAEMSAIAAQLEKQYPDSNRGQGANIVALPEVILGDVRPILLVLLCGAGLLLAIAGANAANLVLVRSEGRRREMAVRSALGGSTGRLFSQFATEGLVLVAAATALGLLGAHWLMRSLLRLIPNPMMDSMPYLRGLGFTPHVLLFAAAIALLSLALLSLAPISRLSLAEMREGLAAGSRGNAGTAWRRFGSKLVVVELATAVVLLVGAALLGQSLYRLLHVDLGFEPERVAALRVRAPDQSYSRNELVVALERRLLRRVAQTPGIESAALSSTLPLIGGNTMWIVVPGRPYHGEHNEVSYREVTPAYFQTLGARLLRGRYFTERDDASHPPVVVIDRALAEKYFPGEDPIGKRITYAPPNSPPPMEIVGLIDEMKESQADQQAWPTMYVSFEQDPTTSFSLVARASGKPEAVLPAIAAAIREIDPAIATFDARTMGQRIDDSPAAYLRRASASLVGGFAALALLLSVIGLYGVMAYSVSQRTREIGVRMALGAEQSGVYRLILRESGWLTALGLAIGLAASVGAASLMRGLLFGIDPWNVPTLAAVAVVLGAAALAASFLPARRAARVSPVEALRAE